MERGYKDDNYVTGTVVEEYDELEKLSEPTLDDQAKELAIHLAAKIMQEFPEIEYMVLHYIKKTINKEYEDKITQAEGVLRKYKELQTNLNKVS